MANIYDLSDTWNDGATTFKGIGLNVTDTASASGSLLMDLQVGGVSKFSVRKDGQAVFDVAGVSCGFKTTGVDIGTYNLLRVGAVQFGPSNDVSLTRDAADTLAQRRSTNPQTFRAYNTFTDASNYERGKIEWASNVLRIGTEKAGTGSARALELQTDGTSRWSVSTAGHLLAFADATYDIGASGATRPRHIYAVNITTESITASVNVIGSGSVIVGSGVNSIKVTNPAAGIALLDTFTTGSFNRLQFGGTTSSFPALKRSTTSLQVRLADDSAFTNIQGKLTTETAYTAGAPTATGYIVLYDSNGTAYKVPAEAL
jgi:hypothetical protein